MSGGDGDVTEAYAAPILALADFIETMQRSELPVAVMQRARWILIDCIGCIVAGNRATEMRRLLQPADARSEPSEAQVIGTGVRQSRARAAELNGMAGTWLDLDEGNLHTKGHAGIQIVPALLAEAEASHASGAAMLRALALGYEVGCRVYGATQARLAVHPHGTYGPLAAAVALACLRDWDAPRIARVIAIAAALGVPASRRTLADGATVRNAFTGASGRAAFHALDLAAAGFSGERDPFASVFGAIYGTAFDAARCIDGLGATWMILRNYFKLHPSARYAHSAIDLLDDLVAAHGALEVGRIEKIELHIYFMATTMGDPRVATPFGARFSIPFILAAHLLGAWGGMGDDQTAAFARAEVHALARRIRVLEDPRATADYPRLQRSALRIFLDDGRMLSTAADFMRGEAERPHSDAALDAKFLALARPSWGAAATDALRALHTIDTVTDFALVCAPWAVAAADLARM